MPTVCGYIIAHTLLFPKLSIEMPTIWSRTDLGLASESTEKGVLSTLSYSTDRPVSSTAFLPRHNYQDIGDHWIESKGVYGSKGRDADAVHLSEGLTGRCHLEFRWS